MWFHRTDCNTPSFTHLQPSRYVNSGVKPARFRSPSVAALHSPLSPHSRSTPAQPFAVTSSTAIRWAPRWLPPKLPALRSSQDAHHRQRKGRSRQFSGFSSAERNTLRLAPCETAFPDRDIPRPFHVWLRCFFFPLFSLSLFAHHAPQGLRHAGTHSKKSK